MSYYGNISLGATLDFCFSSRRFSTGEPFTLGGSPAVAAYSNNSTTELTAGITLTPDFDGRTGLNHVRVVASSGNGYAAGNYALVLIAGTVDSVSVAGEVVGSFSIEARHQLTAADIRAALGMSSANLDTQLSGIQGDTNAIDAKTSQLTFTVPLRVDATASGASATGAGNPVGLVGAQ